MYLDIFNADKRTIKEIKHLLSLFPCQLNKNCVRTLSPPSFFFFFRNLWTPGPSPQNHVGPPLVRDARVPRAGVSLSPHSGRDTNRVRRSISRWRRRTPRHHITSHSRWWAPGVGEREREMFYLTTHSTHFILRLYGVRHIVKDHSDSEKGNPAAATWATLID